MKIRLLKYRLDW